MKLIDVRDLPIPTHRIEEQILFKDAAWCSVCGELFTTAFVTRLIMADQGRFRPYFDVAECGAPFCLAVVTYDHPDQGHWSATSQRTRRI